MIVAIPLRVAAVLLWITALGFGIPGVMGIRSVLSGRGIAVVMGFPTYGNGPLERLGVHSTVPLLTGFLLVCTLEAVAGWLLWGGHRSGAMLALALLPFGAVYWWGFALPFPWVFALVRTVLIAASWRSLS